MLLPLRVPDHFGFEGGQPLLHRPAALVTTTETTTTADTTRLLVVVTTAVAAAAALLETRREGEEGLLPAPREQAAPGEVRPAARLPAAPPRLAARARPQRVRVPVTLDVQVKNRRHALVIFAFAVPVVTIAGGRASGGGARCLMPFPKGRATTGGSEFRGVPPPTTIAR